MINIGTAAGVQTYLSRPVLDPNCVLNCAAHVVPEAWEMEGHTQASGAVLRWFRDEFGAVETTVAKNPGFDAYDLLVEQASSSPPGANDLLFIPTFNGSSAPRVDQNARGCLFGLTLSHSRADVVRALLEGISLELRWMLDAIEEAGIQVDMVNLVGGGARNPFWNQIHADVLGREVRTLECPEAALVGAAMCAAVAIGAYSDLQEASANFVRITDTVEPQVENDDIYQFAYEKYKEGFTILGEGGFFEKLSQQMHK
jgi:xylulokinase